MVSRRHSVRVNAAMIGNDGDDDSCKAKQAALLRRDAELGYAKCCICQVRCRFDGMRHVSSC